MGGSVRENNSFTRDVRESFNSATLTHVVRMKVRDKQLPLFLRQDTHLVARRAGEGLAKFEGVLRPSLLLFMNLMATTVVFSILLPIFDTIKARVNI